jgi:hypothetical protein
VEKGQWVRCQYEGPWVNNGVKVDGPAEGSIWQVGASLRIDGIEFISVGNYPRSFSSVSFRPLDQVDAMLIRARRLSPIESIGELEPADLGQPGSLVTKLKENRQIEEIQPVCDSEFLASIRSDLEEIRNEPYPKHLQSGAERLIRKLLSTLFK